MEVPMEIQQDKVLRQRLRAMTNKLIPKHWGVMRYLVFQQIDKAPPDYLQKLREEMRELLAND